MRDENDREPRDIKRGDLDPEPFDYSDESNEAVGRGATVERLLEPEIPLGAA